MNSLHEWSLTLPRRTTHSLSASKTSSVIWKLSKSIPNRPTYFRPNPYGQPRILVFFILKYLILLTIGHLNPKTYVDFLWQHCSKACIHMIDLSFIILITTSFMLPIILVSVITIIPIILNPVILAITSFLYLWLTLFDRPTTWGMRIVVIDGQILSNGITFIHTFITALNFIFQSVYAVSIFFDNKQ